jgi:hypothetical protein
MMDHVFGAGCDAFHFATRLFLKLELEPDRETALHFFDRIRRRYPEMTRLRRRDNGALILEESSTTQDAQRWVRLDRSGLRFGYFSPPGMEQIREFSDVVLEQAPHHLTLSPLECDRLDVVYGFDLEYRGNHDQLVADTLYQDHPLHALIASDDLTDEAKFSVVDCQPFFAIALTPDCDTQACFEVRSRTSTYEMRTGEFEPQIITVYQTVRRFFGNSEPRPLLTDHRDLLAIADELCTKRVVPVLVAPLAHAIASSAS